MCARLILLFSISASSSSSFAFVYFPRQKQFQANRNMKGFMIQILTVKEPRQQRESTTLTLPGFVVLHINIVFMDSGAISKHTTTGKEK